MPDDVLTTQQQVRNALHGADQIAIIVTKQGKEQQFDGTWLREVLGQDTVPSASSTTQDPTPYGEPSA